MSDLTTSGLVHRAIDLGRLTWTRPFSTAYSTDFASVSTFFAGNPTDSAAWRDTIARVQRARGGRGPTADPDRRGRSVADFVRAQLAGRQAPREARHAAERLEDSAAVAVVTGQQAGLFGGPLYTLLKAVTTIQIARSVEAEHGVPAIPIFWVAGEDHDWAEVRAADVLDADFNRHRVMLADLDGAGTKPVDQLALDGRIGAALDGLEAALAPTEFRNEVLSGLRRHYRPGVTMAGAFAGWIDDLLGRHGLVVFQGADARAKSLVADLFVRELSDPDASASLVAAASAELRARGQAPQVEPAADGTLLFYLDETGRHAIRRRAGGGFVIQGRDYTAAALREEALGHPERFSPNVLLRPVVQDRLFPTICYVAGPAELAYHAEIGGLYRAFGVERPLIQPRSTATLIDSAAAKFLDRHDVVFEDLQVQDQAILNQLVAIQIPTAIDRALEDTTLELQGRLDRLRESIPTVDPTLAGAVETTRDRMMESLKQLHGKIVQASKRKHDTLRRQFLRTQALTFPGGLPQERALNLAFFVNRHGSALVERLIDGLPRDPRFHYLVLG